MHSKHMGFLPRRERVFPAVNGQTLQRLKPVGGSIELGQVTSSIDGSPAEWVVKELIVRVELRVGDDVFDDLLSKGASTGLGIQTGLRLGCVLGSDNLKRGGLV